MKKSRIMALSAIVAGSALVLSACTPPPEEPGTVEGTVINVGWNQPFFSYNSDTSSGNNVTNSLVEYLTRGGFQYYDNDPKLVKDTDYGSFELISEDPQQVRYTINEGVTWSDGVQIDAADMLLQWAALSGNVLTGDDVFFDYASAGGPLSWITKTPEIGEDGRTITLEYDQPYVDWELAFGVNTAAHVTVGLAYPDLAEDAAAAKEQLITAIQEKDVEWLAPVAEAWNTGYDFDATPSNPALLVGSGPYVIESIEKDQYLTVVANESYYGQAPRFERITLRYYGDATAALQAMQNNEIAIYDGQPSPDLLTLLDGAAADGITYAGTAQASYEHVDFTFDNGGPFDPATYGGDEAKALAVRQAFMKIIPRQQIVDDLIKPLQSNAVIRNSQFFIPGGEGYDGAVELSGAAEYDVQDFEGAAALLADAGVSTPIDVRFMHAANNPRREQIGILIQAAGTESGLFNVTLDARTTWGSDLGDGTYDAVTFAWASTSTAVGGSDQIYSSSGGSNFNGYANAEVDRLSSELQATFDPAAQVEIQQKLDELIWKDAYGVTLFQFPGLTFWDEDVVTNVSGNTFVPYYFWNFWEWEPVIAEEATE